MPSCHLRNALLAVQRAATNPSNVERELALIGGKHAELPKSAAVSLHVDESELAVVDSSPPDRRRGRGTDRRHLAGDRRFRLVGLVQDPQVDFDPEATARLLTGTAPLSPTTTSTPNLLWATSSRPPL